MKVLITGFDPFGGEQINPAYEAVKQLPDIIAGAEIIKLEIPTAFVRSIRVVEEAIRKYQPDIVINVGQAGGRSCVTIEQTAVNLADARIPDNDGDQPVDQLLQQDGENAYFTTLPIHAMVKRIREGGLPCFVSYTAGTYVCNAIMYKVQYLIHRHNWPIRVGFIHVPYICQQVVDKPNGTPCMSLTDIAKSLAYAVEATVENYEDVIEGTGGEIC